MSITVSYLTMAGASYGYPAQHGPLIRARASSAVGITSMGVDLHEPLTPEILKYVETPEAEWIDLADEPPPASIVRLRHLIDNYGVTRVNVGVCGTAAHEVAARNLQLLASQVDIAIAVEPVEFGNLSTIADIQKVLKLAEVPTAGLLFDMWQVQSERTIIAPGNIAEVQVSGIPAFEPADALTASQDRATLGDSVIDIPAWLTELQASGVTAPVSYEVPRAAWRAMPCELVAREVITDLSRLS
jgi:hypothetical protein